MKLSLLNPLLLRRLVKSNERIAEALEGIEHVIRAEFGRFDAPRKGREIAISSPDIDDADFTVTTDRDTYEREFHEQHKQYRTPQED